MRTVPIDRISDHPLKGQTRLLGTGEHLDGQFGFGLKGEGIGDVSGAAPGQVSAPLFGKVQFAIDEGMASLGDIGEEDADLTILDGSTGTAILRRDASGVAATFGAAALIGSKNGENRRGCSRGRMQVVADDAT
jgi:hypothetical protein